MNPRPSRVRARAPAKVNLALSVLGQRPDGYHELDTWMLALDLEDELELVRDDSARVSLVLDGPFASADIPRDERNLAVRASAEVLRLAREHGTMGASDGLALRLTKNIPSQSGLGGASSDSAAAWLASEALCGLALEDARREAGLAALGSDCVFFTKARDTGFAHCHGRGERVDPQRLPQAQRVFLLVVPDVACPTERVYAALGKPLSSTVRVPTFAAAWFENPIGNSRAWLSNDLERAALDAVPELRAWRRCLDDCGAAHSRLSGSGSSFFSLHADAAGAGEELGRIEAALAAAGLEPRGIWVLRPLGRGARILSVG